MDAVFLLHRDSAKNEGRMNDGFIFFMSFSYKYVMCFKVRKTEGRRTLDAMKIC